MTRYNVAKHRSRGISTHTLTWSVTCIFSLYFDSSIFQLTRSRGAWQMSRHLNSKSARISTHTLTWSVTGDRMTNKERLAISTHTLTWSVTPKRSNVAMVWSFQLTRSRGAWPFQVCRFLLQQNFNSHAHVERDRFLLLVVSQHRDFNSHAHVERDQALFLALLIKCISTHTLTWSVTLSAAFLTRMYLFQLTRSRGAWLLSIIDVLPTPFISTHTLTWSVTQRK